MTIERFEAGPCKSRVVVHGETVYLAGVVGKDAAGESVSRQTQEIMSIIDSRLAMAGTSEWKLL